MSGAQTAWKTRTEHCMYIYTSWSWIMDTMHINTLKMLLLWKVMVQIYKSYKSTGQISIKPLLQVTVQYNKHGREVWSNPNPKWNYNCSLKDPTRKKERNNNLIQSQKAFQILLTYYTSVTLFTLLFFFYLVISFTLLFSYILQSNTKC